MPEAWKERTLRAPAQELLSADEFGALFGVSGDYVRELSAAGVIAEPKKLGNKFRWTWEAAMHYAFSLRLTFAVKENPPPEIVGDGGKSSGTGSNRR